MFNKASDNFYYNHLLKKVIVVTVFLSTSKPGSGCNLSIIHTEFGNIAQALHSLGLDCPVYNVRRMMALK